MGKGDMKTRRGKIFRGTYGKLRPRKKKKMGNRGRNIKNRYEDLVRITTITNKKTGESIRMVQQPEEFVTKEPRKYYRDVKVTGHLVASGISHEELTGRKKKTEEGKKVFIEAMLLWKNLEQDVNSIDVPKELITLLSINKKSDQEKLLHGMVFTPMLVASLIFEACEKHGYTLRNIRHDIPQKNLDVEKMPAASIVEEDGKVKKIGKSELSDGQIKQAVEHRKVTVAKFLEKGDHWHCFFTTFKSLRGEETWQGEGQPHYHYISNSFGIPKKEVIKQLRSEKYNLGNLPHIKLEDYGKQPYK